MALKAKVATSLLGSENPFQWQIRNDLVTIPEGMIGRLNEKLSDRISYDDDKFSNAVLNIALAYEYFVGGRSDDALRVLCEVEKETENEIDLTTNNWSSALLHATITSQIYILMHNNDFKAAFEKLPKIPSIAEMNESNQAALFGLRAAYYAEYGLCGTKLAVDYAIKAQEKDPENFFWYFLKGKLLGRVRRVEKPFDIPSKVELEALETALQKEWHPACVLFMAELYRETAFHVFKKHRDEETLFPQLKSKIDEMNAQSCDLYRKSVQLKPNCPRIMFRAAKGFIKLPEPYRDDKLAKKLLQDGLKINPDSPYGNHVIAQFYERREKKAFLAIKHLQICADLKVYGACIDLLRLKFHQNLINSEELLTSLNKMYEEYPENPRRCQTLSQLASYYIFVESNLTKAIEYIVQIFRMNPHCDDIFKHRPIYLQVFNTISLVDLIIDEIKIRTQNKNYPTECEIDEKLFHHLLELNLPVDDQKPKYLKNQLVNPSKIVRRDNINFRRPRNRLIPENIHSPKSDERPRLQKVQDFINSWKTEVVARRSTHNLGGTDFDDVISEHAINNDSDSDSQLHRKIYHETANRDKNRKFNMKQNASTKSHKNVKIHSRDHQQNIADEFKNLDITEKKYDRKCDSHNNNSSSNVPSNDSDSDFENSVRAYRKAKQTRNLKNNLPTNEKKIDFLEMPKKQTQSNQNSSRKHTVSSLRSEKVSNIKQIDRSSKRITESSAGIKKSEDECCSRDEIGHKSLIETLTKKFEPKTIKF